MDTIEGMRTFVAVARQASFTSGARQLGISTKLASKYVRQLEERLDAQLLNRTTRSVNLTETGQAYFERCLPLLEQIDELEGLVQERQSELAGSIRITAPTAFGSTHLVSAIQPFQQVHPKVSIDLHLSDNLIPIIEEGIDLAIRFGGLTDSSLIARRLMKMRIVVVASPDYLIKHGEPSHPGELTNHNCLLQKTVVDPDHWGFRMDGKNTSIRVRGNFQSNSPRAIATMAAGGLGIGMCPFYVVQPFLATGALKILFARMEATEFALYAVYPSSHHLSARIRAFIDHLAISFG